MVGVNLNTVTSFRLGIVYHQTDGPIVRGYSEELNRRGIQTHEVEVSELSQFDTLLSSSTNILFVCSPQLLKEPAIDQISERIGRGNVAIGVITLEPIHLPSFLLSFPRIHEEYLGSDLAFERILRFAVGPLPSWLQLFCRKSQMRTITGASWWGDDMIVADEYFDHVLKLQGDTSSVLLAGLDEPAHIHLDRRTLLVSNVSANEVICAHLRGGGLWNLRSLTGAVCGKQLKRPHSAFQGGGISAIADTDNHRVLWKRGWFNDPAEWNELPFDFDFPCAVYGSDAGIWVVDTFNHRVLDISLQSRIGIRAEIGGHGVLPGGFAFPVGLCTWRDMIFVSDEENRRLQHFGHDATTWACWNCELGSPFVVSPFGVSMNRGRRLLVGDRARGCCWVVDLAEYGALGEISVGRD